MRAARRKRKGGKGCGGGVRKGRRRIGGVRRSRRRVRMFGREGGIGEGEGGFEERWVVGGFKVRVGGFEEGEWGEG